MLLKVLLVSSILSVPLGNTGSSNGETLFTPTYARTKYLVEYVVKSGSAALGPTAPSWMVHDSCAGYEFDADADNAVVMWEIPNCWTGADNLTLRIYWCAEAGDVPAQNETVKFDITYRSIVWGTEDTDNGAVATGTVTYTEAANPGDAEDTHISEITIPYTGGNQPVAAGDSLVVSFDRDKTGDTYSGGAVVALWELAVYQNRFDCDHK